MRHAFSATLPRIRVTGYACALAALSFLLLSPRVTQAQLGKLKKLGADAIKDAAKDKLGTDKKDAATSAAGAQGAAAGKAKAAGMPMLDDARITLVLASLMPQVKAAQIRADAAAAAGAYLEKKKAGDACVQRAAKTIDPMAVSASAEKNSARITAIQKQTEPMQRRLDQSYQSKDLRTQLFLQDSVTVLTMRSTSLAMGVSCTFDFAPPAMIEARVMEVQAASSGSANEFDPGESVRGALSRYEYGLLRERVALWALVQDTPTLKGLGKEGVFTADEQAALATHSAEIRKLTPLFKSDAMIWKGWDDLRDW